MKKFILNILFLFSISQLFSQTDGISYQAVIIDNNPQEIPGVDIASNNLPNTSLNVRFSIIDNVNFLEYQETHNTQTDAYGMINLMIGQGTSIIGTFNQIYWNNSKYLQVEIDLLDGKGMIEFSYQELTYIPYVKHREIIATSTLDVDGVTNLNNNFTVNNQSPTLLTGDLTVEGIVSFDGGLDVGGDTQLYADLTVEGTAFLNGDLIVLGQANFSDGTFENLTVTQNTNLNLLDVSGIANLNSTLTVEGASTLNSLLNVNASSNLNGRVWINANRDSFGSDLNSNAYPLRISGSKQGIEVELTGNASGDRPNNGNNFISFSSDTIRYGRIEGQTSSELTSSFIFVWYATQASLETAFQLAMVIVDLIGIDDGDAAIVEGIEMVEIIANWTGQNVYNLDNVGVSFSSGFGDYAEWLEKNNTSEGFSYGDVIGVVGGKISKNTNDADHFMVISQNPIVLGNMQQENRQKDFEKVAFMGQVPVKVIGKVSIGDYIIPSGLNDGIGRAISPKDLNIKEYNKIVGVAWSSSETNGLSLINLAVGINANNTAQIFDKQQNEINSLKNELNSIITYLKSKDASFSAEELTVNSNLGNVIVQQQSEKNLKNQVRAIAEDKRKSNNINSDNLKTTHLKKSNKYKKILKMLEENPKVLDDILADARADLDAKGIKYKLYEQTNLLVTDKNYFLKHLRALIK